MNITPQNHHVPVATVVNPQTDSLRRENNLREVITQPSAATQSAAEKGVASEKERSKTPAQDNELIDFEGIRKRAEKEDSTITESSENGERSASEEHPDSDEHHDHNHKQDPEIIAEEQEIRDLQQRDQEVKAHERAHASVGGTTTGAPSYSYEIGPDGKKYAVSGEVSVDLSKVPGNPSATITKMQKVHAAALAPINPSAQDVRVAALATKAILEAQTELLLENEDTQGNSAADGQSKSTLKVEGQENDDSDFDKLINQTLESQESIAPTRDTEIVERAQRIESFYSDINQAYEKPSPHQFLLTA
jgi:hypothetical protein